MADFTFSSKRTKRRRLQSKFNYYLHLNNVNDTGISNTANSKSQFSSHILHELSAGNAALPKDLPSAMPAQSADILAPESSTSSILAIPASISTSVTFTAQAGVETDSNCTVESDAASDFDSINDQECKNEQHTDFRGSLAQGFLDDRDAKARNACLFLVTSEGLSLTASAHKRIIS